MKILILIRHAKSSWNFPLRDIDRPLKKRGIADAHLISDHLKNKLPKKFLMYSSSARRAFDTAKIIAQNLIISEDLIIKDQKLYAFEQSALKRFIKNLNNSNDSIILFGHNDAITDFVNKFGDTYIDKVPTSGVVYLEFLQNDWNEIKDGKVKFTIFPKDFRNETQTSE